MSLGASFREEVTEVTKHVTCKIHGKKGEEAAVTNTKVADVLPDYSHEAFAGEFNGDFIFYKRAFDNVLFPAKDASVKTTVCEGDSTFASVSFVDGIHFRGII